MRPGQVVALRLFNWVTLALAVGGGGLVLAGALAPTLPSPQSVPSFEWFPTGVHESGFFVLACFVAAAEGAWAARQSVALPADRQHAVGPAFGGANLAVAAWLVAYPIGTDPSLVVATAVAACFVALSCFLYVRQASWLLRSRKGLHLVADVAASWMVGFGLLVLGTNVLQCIVDVFEPGTDPSPFLRSGTQYGLLIAGAGIAAITRWDPAMAVFLFGAALLSPVTDFAVVACLLAFGLAAYAGSRKCSVECCRSG